MTEQITHHAFTGSFPPGLRGPERAAAQRELAALRAERMYWKPWRWRVQREAGAAKCGNKQ